MDNEIYSETKIAILTPKHEILNITQSKLIKNNIHRTMSDSKDATAYLTNSILLWYILL